MASASLVLALAGLARADDTPTPDTPVVAPPVLSTTTDTTTAATTTTASTTTETVTVTTALAPAVQTREPPPRVGCAVVGAVALELPNRRRVLLGPVASAPAVYLLTQDTLAYPADGSVVTAAGISVDAGCDATHSAGGSAQVRSLSLFAGAVTAHSVTLRIAGGAGTESSTVNGLRVNGRPTFLLVGRRVRLGDWGYLAAPVTRGDGRRVAATGGPGARSVSALSVQLVQAHGGLPAGTVLLVDVATLGPERQPAPLLQPPARPIGPAKLAERPTVVGRPGPTRQPLLHRPLTLTPPLRAGPYVFPVVGAVSFGDTYGAARSDVADGWHHGDDIFAPLGAPVVAVAAGTLNRVGWDRLGGWRLWVRDRAGDEFYYAHLSGYTALALRHGRVKAGQVIGFVGNTGDAFPSLTHLHFEVHPRGLLHLQYDGAVDPSSYLNAWVRPARTVAPPPVHPRLPTAAAALAEARQNFRELIRTRTLTRPQRTKVVRTANPLQPPLAAVAPVPPAPISKASPYAWAGLDASLAVASLALLMWRRSRRTQ